MYLNSLDLMYARYIPPQAEPRAATVTPQPSNGTKNKPKQSSKRKRLDEAKASPSKRNRHGEKDDEKEIDTQVPRVRERVGKKLNKLEISNGREAAEQPDLATSSVDGVDNISTQNGRQEHKEEDPLTVERSARKAERRAARKAAREATPSEDDEKPSKAHARILAKFEKSALQPVPKGSDDEESVVAEEAELRDLVPIPRPKGAINAFAKPTFSTLPSWLSEPIIATSEQRTAFSDLGIESELLSKLTTGGFGMALPVQASVLPLLLPTHRQHPGDVCVSAATGSGKTIAYVLPIIQSLRHRVEPRLRALLVVPTRELVSQVRQVAETFVKGSDLKIGTAVGTHTLKAEQEALVHRANRYDPDGWQKLRLLLDESADDLSHWDDPEHHARVEEALVTLPGHVPEYRSKVDILICTPGRLVDHIKNTRGFTLANLEWLVIDEADRLLDQSFQEWSDTVNKALLQSQRRDCRPSFRRGVRKVMLSATMTSNLSQLDALKLQNPRLVVVGDMNDSNRHDRSEASASATVLPPTLREHAVPVGDGSLKPLYMMQLIDAVLGRTSEFSKDGSIVPTKSHREVDMDQDSGDDSDDSSSVLSSDSDSVTSSSSGTSEDSVTSSVSSPASSISSSADAASSMSVESPGSSSVTAETSTVPLLHGAHKTSVTNSNENALIFTSTNEAALRLSSLLTILSSGHGKPYRIASITKSSNASGTRAILQAFNSGAIQVLVASDRIARGLDLPSLSTVINYDVPRSMTSYVHRAGRTARAGRHGTAWTLLESHEARWFWKEIGGAEAKIGRPSGNVVHRTRLMGEKGWSEQARAMYSEALERLKKDVMR